MCDYYCRMCRVTKFQAKKLCEEDKNLLRNINNYEKYAAELEAGIKSYCVFNDLPHFHCAINKICDPMHDLNLGTNRYDMTLIINYCIKKNSSL